MNADARRHALAHASLWLACTFTCIHVLYTMGFEGPWLPLDDALTFDAHPPFRHRVLFVWLARGIGEVFPSFFPPRLYFLTQFLAAGIAFWAIQPWAERFLPPRVAAWSRPVLLAMLVPTFTYWTFYDLGIVATFTLALWALVARRFALYLAIFWLGTLNHENTLLLVPVALLLRAGDPRDAKDTAETGPPPRQRIARLLAWGALQVAGYAAIRWALFHFLPVPAAWQSGKLAYNLGLVLRDPVEITRTVVLGAAWAAIVWTGWSRLPRAIQLALLVLGTELLLVTLFLGQLNELRQFDALLPPLVVAILIALGGRAKRERTSPAPVVKES